MVVKKNISIFYLQCVLICMGIVLIISLYLYVKSDDIQERIPIYFPRVVAFEDEEDINNTVYIPEFRIIPDLNIYDIIFHSNTYFVLRKVLHELLLGSQSIYTKKVIPQGVSVHSLSIGLQDEDNTYKVFIQLEVSSKNVTKHDFEKIKHWLEYNMNVYFPSYTIQVIK